MVSAIRRGPNTLQNRLFGFSKRRLEKSVTSHLDKRVTNNFFLSFKTNYNVADSTDLGGIDEYNETLESLVLINNSIYIYDYE